jgi:hypothetical protein
MFVSLFGRWDWKMRGGDASEDGGGGWSTGKRRWPGNDVPSRPHEEQTNSVLFKKKKI